MRPDEAMCLAAAVGAAAALNLAAEQGTGSGTQDRAGGPFAASVDRAANQGTRGTADDQAHGPVRALAVAPAVFTLPVTDAVIGRVLPLLLLLVMMPTMMVGERRGGGDHEASGGKGESNLFHGIFLSLE